MQETAYRSPETAALHSALLEIDHSEVTEDARRSIRSRMLMIHSYQGPGDDWKAQYSLALARSLSKHNVEFDADVVRIGIDIVWNYFQRLDTQLKVLNASFEAERQVILGAVLEVAQHAAMLSQIKFQFVSSVPLKPMSI